MYESESDTAQSTATSETGVKGASELGSLGGPWTGARELGERNRRVSGILAPSRPPW